MITYFGPHKANMYMRGKHIRFAVKAWVLASSNACPYLITFNGGKHEARDLLLWEYVVQSFLALLVNPKKHCFYVDK